MVFLGLLCGLLVNYLADILPIRRQIAQPVCIHCGTPQSLWNYFVWPRRCPNCRISRGARVWLVEIAYAAFIPWLALSDSATSIVPFPAAVLIWIFFGVVIVIDVELKLILHPVSIAGSVLGLAIGLALYGPGPTLLGGAAGYAILFILYWLGALFTRLTRRLQGDDEEVALGYGDVNLAGVLGLMVGWPNILISLILSVLIAGAFSVIFILITLVLRRYRAFMAIPYGPFLIAGAALLLFFPETAQRMAEAISPLFFLGP